VQASVAWGPRYGFKRKLSTVGKLALNDYTTRLGRWFKLVRTRLGQS